MAGVFSFSTSMENKKLSLGYRKLALGGIALAGHEFRYSSLLGAAAYPSEAPVYSARGHEVETKVFRHKAVWASYIHFYWAENRFLEHLLAEKEA